MSLIAFIARLQFCFITILTCFNFCLEGSPLAGFLALPVGLYVSYPAFNLLLHHQRPPNTFKIPEDHISIMRWIRKGLAMIGAIMAIWIFKRAEYLNGALLLLLCLILLSPLEDLLFRPSNKVITENDWRRAIIIAARNIGLVLYLIAINTYWLLVIPGILLVFIRPILLYISPYKEEAPDEVILQEETITPQPVAAEEHPTAEHPLKQDFLALQQLPPQRRGFAFQGFLNQLFDHYNMKARSAFRLTGEEIDGSFEIGAHFYLLEAKWQAKASPQSDLLTFSGKVEGKATWTRGLFISYAGFTQDGLQAFSRGKRTSIIGMDANDLLCILDKRISLPDAINLKVSRAVMGNEFFVPLDEILLGDC